MNEIKLHAGPPLGSLITFEICTHPFTEWDELCHGSYVLLQISLCRWGVGPL